MAANSRPVLWACGYVVSILVNGKGSDDTYIRPCGLNPIPLTKKPHAPILLPCGRIGECFIVPANQSGVSSTAEETDMPRTIIAGEVVELPEASAEPEPEPAPEPEPEPEPGSETLKDA